MALLITPDYADQNRELHEMRADYGKIGHRWADRAAKICRERGFRSVIDYGAGKGTFSAKMQRIAPEITVQNYDPATYPMAPEPAELVVCTDVLEHVEPDCLDAVLEHIRLLGNHFLLVIALCESDKTLPDGRNAHLTVADHIWWRRQMARAGITPVVWQVWRHDLVFEGC